MHEIIKTPEKWEEAKQAISIGETIMRLAIENRDGIPLSILKARLHKRVKWKEMEQKIPEIAKILNAVITQDGRKKRGRTATLFVVPEDWREGSGLDKK